MKLYRSVLFVPGNRPDWIDKAPKYGPDALILDLEDAVPNAEKVDARKIVRAGIERSRERGVPTVVRVNGVNTGLTAEDVEAIVTNGLVAVAIPKLERVEEILKVDAWIEFFERMHAGGQYRWRGRRSVRRCDQGDWLQVDAPGAGNALHGVSYVVSCESRGNRIPLGRGVSRSGRHRAGARSATAGAGGWFSRRAADPSIGGPHRE